MPVPEGFIMPTLGTALGNNVLKAVPTADVVAGAMGVMSAEIRRHKEYNAEKTRMLEQDNLPGEMSDEIELVLITADKYTKVPLRASNLTTPKARFTNELSLEQQMQLAELREKFRQNEHGSDTPVALWDALNVAEQMQLVNLGVHYVEQLANFKDHEIYKLGNGGEDLVKRARRHMDGKRPDKSDDFERQMSALMDARQKETARADEMEKRYLEMQARLAALETEPTKKKPGRPPRRAGVQEE